MATPNGVLTYAGVKLPVWPGTAAPWVAKQITLKEYMPFDGWDWYQVSDLQHLNLTSPFSQPETSIGSLRWPARAARWAVAHFVLNSNKLAEIRDAVGNTNQAQPFVMDDKITGGTVETDLYMLPPRPLLVGEPQTDDGKLWLVTFVDVRFFWWRRLLTIEAVPLSWDSLFDQIENALSVTINHPTIPSEYLEPTYRYQVHAVPVPLILDSAAEAVGMRFVRTLGGNCHLQRWVDAYNASDLLFSTWTSPIEEGDYAGRGRIMGGGQMASADIARAVPASVAVIFGRREGDTVLSGVHGRLRNLVEYTHPSASLELYTYYGTGTAGMSNVTARFTADAFAEYSGDLITNGEELDDLAERAAYDWYGWRLADKDMQLAGTIPWHQDAFADQTVWTWREREVHTRVIRDPYFDHNVYGSYPRESAVGSDWFAARITGFTDSEADFPPGPLYSWIKIKLVKDGAGPGIDAFVDDDTLSGEFNAYRMPTAEYESPVLPAISVGQSVLCRASPTFPGKYEITPWGAFKRLADRPLLAFCVACETLSGGSNVISLYGAYMRRRIYARELLGTYGASGDSMGPYEEPYDDG